MPDQVLVAVDDQPYVKIAVPTAVPGGLETIHTEIVLKRGAWVEGRVVDRTTGKPVQAVVEYCPFGDNPHLRDYGGASFLNNIIGDEPEFPTDAQGRFRAVALPGGGVLAVRTVDTSYAAGEALAPQYASRLLQLPSFRRSDHYQALLPIEVTGRETLAIPEIKVARGRTVQIKVRVMGEDGKPLSGAKVVLLERRSLAPEPVAGTEYTFIHSRPGKAESMVILHEERGLGRFVEIIGDEAGPLDVILLPMGTVEGRLVDEKGVARANVEIQAMFLRNQGVDRHVEELDAAARTGPDGRFQIKHLVPGLFYSFEVLKQPEKNMPLRSEGYIQRGRWPLLPGRRDWGVVTVTRN